MLGKILTFLLLIVDGIKVILCVVMMMGLGIVDVIELSWWTKGKLVRVVGPVIIKVTNVCIGIYFLHRIWMLPSCLKMIRIF